MTMKIKRNILVVDDDPTIRKGISLLLKANGYNVFMSTGAREAIQKIKENYFDAVLSDIKMPEVSGIGLLEEIRKINKDIPVILMTAYPELDSAINALSKGATDFLTKPFKSETLRHTVEKAIDHYRLLQMEKEYKKDLEDTIEKRTLELKDTVCKLDDLSKEIINRLTTIAEFRDTDTGYHNSRMRFYSKKIAEQMKLSNDFINTLEYASPLHDIGKVAIHDDILLKKDFLTAEEFNIMKTHTLIGQKILSNSSHPVLQTAASIALNHHERFDGSGYPNGLKGDKIPVEGRILFICDQYDALRSKRPYKTALHHQKVVEILTKGDGRTIPSHFDPDVLKAFIKLTSAFDEIFSRHQ